MIVLSVVVLRARRGLELGVPIVSVEAALDSMDRCSWERNVDRRCRRGSF
jgi:hypothetical protein